MPTIQVYNEEQDRNFSVTFTLQSTILNVSEIADDMAFDYYLLITTNMTQADGTAFDTFMVRDLTDVPPGVTPPASNFTELSDHDQYLPILFSLSFAIPIIPTIINIRPININDIAFKNVELADIPR